MLKAPVTAVYRVLEMPSQKTNQVCSIEGLGRVGCCPAAARFLHDPQGCEEIVQSRRLARICPNPAPIQTEMGALCANNPLARQRLFELYDTSKATGGIWNLLKGRSETNNLRPPRSPAPCGLRGRPATWVERR